MSCSLGSRIAWFGVAAALFIGALRFEAATAVESSARLAALSSITSGEAQKFVEALADDTFEGREAGSRGGRAAGIYIVERLKQLGLAAGGRDGYYQQFGGYANILAWIPGQDPEVKQQVIVLGAHYDHVGYGTSRNSYGPIGNIHNGADDNASGVAGLLEVAEALARLPAFPRRSILIAFWDGEEKGLLGSKHWVENPTVPLSQVEFAINTDMIGRLRNGRIEVFGVRTCRGLRRLLSEQNVDSQLVLDFNWDLRPDSDHHSFCSREIPILMPFTGMHGDYHRPSDDAERINAEGIRRVASFVFNVAVELADGPTLAGFRSQARSESKADQERREAALPQPPGRLGIRWDEAQADAGRIVVAGTSPGSAAERGGIRAGDQIVAFAEQPVTGAQQFRSLVLSAANLTTARVERPGAPEPLDLKLELSGEPARLGISWRTDEAEPGVVILNRVINGSPAEAAGLKSGDRIYKINGHNFDTGDQFGEQARTGRSPLSLQVESLGRIREVEMVLP